MRQNFLLLCSFTLLCWDERFLLDNLCMYYPPIIISFSFILRSQLNPYPTTGQLCSQILLYRAIFIAISATKPQWEFIWILIIHCKNFVYFENITTFDRKDYIKMSIVIFHMNVDHIEIQIMVIFGIVIWFILPNMTCFVMLL